MRKYNILVTGIGAIIGYGVIHSLRKSRYDTNIIGIDIFEDAVGQVWCDNFIQAKLAADPDYISFLKNIIDNHKIDLVFFGTEQEIQKCYQSKQELGEYYKKLVINNDNIIELSEDKWLTGKFLKDNGLNAIPASITANFEQAEQMFGLPLLMKPRKSYASKGIMKVSTKSEFNKWQEEYADQFMVQQLIGDEEHEYTAATFGFNDGSCIKPIILRRKLSKAGATDKAFVETIPELEEEIYRITKILKPLGPTNYQFRKHNGKYYLLEINPRISSSTSIRTAFGYNESEMCVKYFLEGIKPESCKIRQGRAIRYITETVEYYDSDNL